MSNLSLRYEQVVAPCLTRDVLLSATGVTPGEFGEWSRKAIYRPVSPVGRGGARNRTSYSVLDALRLVVIKTMLRHSEPHDFVRAVVGQYGALDQFVTRYFLATDKERPSLDDTVWVTHRERGQVVVDFLEKNQAELATFGRGEGADHGLSDIWWLRPAGVIGRLLLVLSFDLQRHFRIPPEL